LHQFAALCNSGDGGYVKVYFYFAHYLFGRIILHRVDGDPEETGEQLEKAYVAAIQLCSEFFEIWNQKR
jgi:hypothetical protein